LIAHNKYKPLKQVKMETTISKSRVISGWILAGLLTALFLFSAFGKFTSPQMMEQLKLGDWRNIIAVGEIVSTALFLFPKTNKWGTLLLSAYMGGAIVAHMISGLPIYMPSVILIFVWVVGFLRNPKLIGFY
jgi:hypothetical protein